MMNRKEFSADNKKSRQSSDPDEQSASLEALIAEIDMETPRMLEDEYLKRLSIIDKSIMGDYGQDQYLKFSLGEMLFVLPLLSALEIGNKLPVTQLPNLPGWLVGVSNVRGEIVSIVDLKLFFQLPLADVTLGKRLIIIHNSRIKIGIIVDKILGMLPLDEDDQNMQEAPHEGEIISEFIKGVIPMGDQSLNMLNIDRLLSSSHLNQFNYE